MKKSYALPIAIMFALFFMIAFVTGLPSPMGVIVAEQFGATVFQSQLGVFSNFIAYAFMGIPAGLMLKRFGYKRTALAGITVGFVGVGIQYLSGMAGSFAIYLTGAFVAGFSMCLLNTVVNPMLNTLGGGGRKGNQLLQFGGTLSSIAATLTPVLVGYLMGAASGRTIEKANPAMFIALGVFAVAFIVLRSVKIPEPHIEAETDVAQNAIKRKLGPLSFRHFTLGIIAIFVYVGVEVGIPSTVNLYMTNGLGTDAAVAGSVVGTYWFLMLIGRLIGGAVGTKVGVRAMMTSVSVICIALIISAITTPQNIIVRMPALQSEPTLGIIMAHVPLSVMLLTLCGLCTSVMWGGIFNLSVEGLGRYTEAASGWFMVMVCGGGIIPLIQGRISDQNGYIQSYWLLAVCVGYILLYVLWGSRNHEKETKTE